MVAEFPATEPAWALRVYLVLIGCAADRQTVTYGALAQRVKRGGPICLKSRSTASTGGVHDTVSHNWLL
jgi:hypothetical protein